MLSSPITWKEFFEMYYRDELNKIAGKIMCNSDGKYPLNVKAKDLMVFREGKLFEELFKDPIKVIEDATKSLESITTIYPVTLSGENVSVRFVNIPESRRTLVKNLGHKHVGKFVSVVGIVRKISEPSSLVKRVAYVCTRCGNKVEVESRNMVIPKPSYCDNCKKRSKFVVDDDSITRISFQKLKLQDLPEHLEASEIPVFLDAYLTGDLVQSVRAGDKVVLNGILKSDERRIERGSAIESFYLDVNSVELLEKDIRSIRITKEDERKIKELAKDPNIYDKLVKSIAPSILGHDEIKLAIALQLFGGCPIETPDGRIRGDIHILLVGDPSVAKSRLTRAVANIAPRAVLSTGLTSSGAGLTVSVMKDEGGRWNIEAGVLVLADKGLAVIDELEKMSKDDRRYILEALEQQTITVAKAGIHAVLNSRCSVLATANPKYGNFDRYTPVIDQINIESNLLSRFDLVFVLFDEPNESKDGKIAEFLLKGVSNSKPEIDTDLLRKYILYAKENVKNVELSDEAFELIKDFYVKLRSSTGDKITITARQLEGLRRLAQASAKVQLRTVATREDAERAIELMKASLSMWALDPETGEIDISYGLSGIGSKTKDKIRLIKNIISEMDNGDGAIYEEVIQKAQELGISQPDAEKILEKLREVGDIYFPRFNRVKLAY
ncbi:MAG: hypothetical protein DRQ41_13375 [Gammaproteobacteria bacterium]|nr:MAG: hypothetical protein DRQ41_13375 [Gammaproteobacteria bacterium]